MSLGDEVDEVLRREVKSLPVYAKAQAASGSGVAPPVNEMNQLLMGLETRRAFVSPTRRSHRKYAEGLRSCAARRGLDRSLEAQGLLRGRPTMAASSESEVLAQELSNMAGKVGALEARLKDVEAVINRLEGAAETTARALEEVSAHWDAVYRAMRRARVTRSRVSLAADSESPPPRAPFAVARLVLRSQRDADSARQFALGAAFGDARVLAGSVA